MIQCFHKDSLILSYLFDLFFSQISSLVSALHTPSQNCYTLTSRTIRKRSKVDDNDEDEEEEKDKDECEAEETCGKWVQQMVVKMFCN